MPSRAFAPSPEARSLTHAPHVTRESTPVTVRFSNGTGLPLIPDNAPDSNPRGLAIRFHLADRVPTDIVSHSTDGFPTRTGQEFLDFLRAAATGDPSAFLAAHPAALAFAQTPKPNPASFGRGDWYWEAMRISMLRRCSWERKFGTIELYYTGDTFWIDEAWLSRQGAPRQESSDPLTQTVQSYEKEFIEAALAESRGKVTKWCSCQTRNSQADARIKH
jgi:hypothetical protein